eukprot:c17732_g1_i1 orf=304-813(-)
MAASLPPPLIHSHSHLPPSSPYVCRLSILPASSIPSVLCFPSSPYQALPPLHQSFAFLAFLDLHLVCLRMAGDAEAEAEAKAQWCLFSLFLAHIWLLGQLGKMGPWIEKLALNQLAFFLSPPPVGSVLEASGRYLDWGGRKKEERWGSRGVGMREVKLFLQWLVGSAQE